MNEPSYNPTEERCLGAIRRFQEYCRWYGAYQQWRDTDPMGAPPVEVIEQYGIWDKMYARAKKPVRPRDWTEIECLEAVLEYSMFVTQHGATPRGYEDYRQWHGLDVPPDAEIKARLGETADNLSYSWRKAQRHIERSPLQISLAARSPTCSPSVNTLNP